MEPERFEIASSRGDETLNCYRWMPEGEPVASLQIVHGMTEHILRYSDFASYLNSRRIAVYGHDHLGHGGTSEEKGFIAEENGDDMLVSDMGLVNGYENGTFRPNASITRAEAYERISRIVAFLKDDCETFHGAFSHWIDGSTGETLPFSPTDNGADIVETSFLMQGLDFLITPSGITA